MDVTLSSRQLAWHEAHHAPSLLVSGWPPVWARIDWPRELGGSVRPDWEARELDEAAMRDLAVATLQGPLGEGRIIGIEWPLEVEDWDTCRADGKTLNFIGAWLNLDRVSWLQLVERAQRQGQAPRFRRLVVAVAGALEEREIVGRPELIRLAEAVA